jgi:hypothetical protein
MKRVAEKGYKSEELLKTRQCILFQCSTEDAAKWYGELFTMTTDLEPEYYYRYASS